MIVLCFWKEQLEDSMYLLVTRAENAYKCSNGFDSRARFNEVTLVVEYFNGPVCDYCFTYLYFKFSALGILIMYILRIRSFVFRYLNKINF